MKSLSFVSIVLFTIFCQIYCLNTSPLIGVLSQDSDGDSGQSFIVASYVKYLESAGARVVPIVLNKHQDYYKRIVEQTDGLLLPGGQDLHSSGYLNAGKMLWDIIMNNKTRSYPIWGTSMGFELLINLMDSKLNFQDCDAVDVANNLELSQAHITSRLFGKADQTIKDILSYQKVAYDYHKKCLLYANQSSEFTKFFEVLSTTKVNKNNGNQTIVLEYISTIESKDKKHPVYGVQWHPEENRFEFTLNKNRKYIPHSSDAVLVSQYMSEFFVDQVRQLSTRVTDETKVNDILIYKFKSDNKGYQGDTWFQEVYYFNTSPSTQWRHLIAFSILLIFKKLFL